MRFEWDESKRLNIMHHHGRFIDMVQIFDGRPTFTYHSPRRAENRWGTRWDRERQFYLVVWTMRGERRRIISAYRADDWEIREYRKLYG